MQSSYQNNTLYEAAQSIQINGENLIEREGREIKRKRERENKLRRKRKLINLIDVIREAFLMDYAALLLSKSAQENHYYYL